MPRSDPRAAAPEGIGPVLEAHVADLGEGFQVRRLLPSAQRRSVGPFVFFDHFGPVIQPAGVTMDVRPHPHIGLATLTYLFEGAILHRDSLGTVQAIEPGALNWMRAGRGIVHSERTPDALRGIDRELHGLQLWLALPSAQEEAEPEFRHIPAERIPELAVEDAQLRVLIGHAWGSESPLRTPSPTLYLAGALAGGGRIELPLLAEQQAVYALDQGLMLDAFKLPPQRMAVLGRGVRLHNPASRPARFVVIGGAPLDGPRFIWWNFVSSRRERIVQAAADWEARRFATVPGDEERIELPEGRPPGSG